MCEKTARGIIGGTSKNPVVSWVKKIEATVDLPTEISHP